MKLIPLSLAFIIASSALAQETVTVTTGPGNATQTYYSLTNGVQGEATLAAWDLAFEITGITGCIRVNTAKGQFGIKVYKAPYAVAQWDQVDTTGLASGWLPQQNSEIAWNSGALNQGLTSNPFDLGWGIYNQITHNITGDSVFVLQMDASTWKKLRIDGYSNSTDAFTFTWSDLDGGQQTTGSLTRSDYAGMNFGYYDLGANSPVSMEPPTMEWDLVFGKYLAFVTEPYPTFYPVVGCQQNRGISTLQVNDTPTDLASWSGGPYSADMNVIGHDWKSFNMTTFMWEYETERTYFVQDRSGNIWKIIFIAYGGGANGDVTFTKELVSSVGVNEQSLATTELGVYPNPTSQGTVQVVLGATSSSTMLSVIDQAGRVVIEQLLPKTVGASVRTVDVSTLSSGLYSIRVFGDGVQASSRLIVQ